MNRGTAACYCVAADVKFPPETGESEPKVVQNIFSDFRLRQTSSRVPNGQTM